MRRLLHGIWTEFRYRGFTLASWLAYRLPRRLVYWIGGRAGNAAYFILKRHAADTVSNMRRVLGEGASWQKVKRTAQDSFRNYGRLSVDFLRLPHMTDDEVYQVAGVPAGLENIDRALERG